MLQRSLTEHVAECFFGDAQLSAMLWKLLQQPADELDFDCWRRLQEDFYQLLVERVEAHYPREHRLTDVRQLMERMLDGNLLFTSKLPLLDELQQRLLQRNGDLLCYRESEIQAYVRLAAGLDPSLLVGWHLAQWLNDIPQPQAQDIRRVVSAQTAFFAPLSNPSLPFAEGHVHFWGVTADSAILDDYLLAGEELKPSKKAKLWQRQQYDNLEPVLQCARRLLLVLLEQCCSDNWSQHLERFNLAMDTPIHKPDWKLLAASQSGRTLGSADWLLGEFALSMKRSDVNRWLWLYVYLCRRYDEQDTHPLQRAAILCFWQTINQLRRSLIMDGQGLTRFAERYFDSVMQRKPIGNDNIRRLWPASVDMAEIKSRPLAFEPKFASKIVRGLIANARVSLPKPPYIFGESDIKLDRQTLAALQVMERWQFCGHFSRSQEHKKSRRPKSNSKNLWQEAESLMRNLHSTSGWSAPEFLGGKLNPDFHFQPARWFRGLDVAGDENALKIEWFAPVLRWLRSGFKSFPDGEQASTGFHLSIHAGEDYAHPASGMRHVDETPLWQDSCH